LSDSGFHPTTLLYWRRRLAASQRPNGIFDAVRAVIAHTGIRAGKSRRALDSTMLEDAVATQDIITSRANLDRDHFVLPCAFASVHLSFLPCAFASVHLSLQVARV
jgi:hypothetical protein